MSTTRTLSAVEITGAGRQAMADVPIQIPDGGTGRTPVMCGVLTETVPVASFTDGGSTSGTYQMLGSLPAGAQVLGTKILVPAGFAGDTTAVCIIGDGTDTDRYMTGTPSVFATAAAGVECGVPSGAKLLTAENRPTITITSTADFTSVKTNNSGIITVSIAFFQAA